MKKLFLSLLPCLLAAVGIAQNQFINYQGIARNATGQPLNNQTILVISRIVSDPTGGVLDQTWFQENRTVTTNQFGLYNFQIGSTGATSFGTFSSIPWRTMTNPRLLTFVSLTNTVSNAVQLSETKLASVPYAFMAGQAKPWLTNGATIQPDLSSYNLALGTTGAATAKLDVVGKIRMADGTQADGYVMTSDANGIASWKANATAATSLWAKTGNRVRLVTNSDSVGIGTAAPSAKLHVLGKLRLEDGTQGFGYQLTSDGVGRASWEKPAFTPYSNNIGVGVNYLYVTDTTKSLLIGTNSNTGFGTGATRPGLYVNGLLKFTDNGGPEADGNVMTYNSNGYAGWKSLADNPYNHWVKGTNSTYGNDLRIRASSNIQLLQVDPPRTLFQTLNPPTGSWTNWLEYPVAIRNVAGNTGLSINLYGGVPHDRKYITFFDNTGVKGRIEGQTVADLQEDPQYITYIAIQTLSTGAFLAEGIACGFQADFFEVAVQAAQAGIWGADLGTQIAYLEGNAGIAYVSGSGDYAEWLEKGNLAEKFTFGDIVSVNGGKISKTLFGAGQLMVISKAPIVLGNMPDEKDKSRYEKVAFMGQVPVKVRGEVAIGDYIVAAEDGSGIGYAVHPASITADEMQRIVGVAWSASTGSTISMINTAVGLNTHSATKLIQKQEGEIGLLKNTLNQLSAYLQTKDPTYQYTKLPVTATETGKSVETASVKATPVNSAVIMDGKTFATLTPADKMKRFANISTDRVKKLITEQQPYLDAAIKAIVGKMQEANPEAAKNPQIQRLVNDRAFLIETIKKAYGIS